MKLKFSPENNILFDIKKKKKKKILTELTFKYN